MHDELNYVDSHNNVVYHAMITVIDGASHDILIITLNYMISNQNILCSFISYKIHRITI